MKELCEGGIGCSIVTQENGKILSGYLCQGLTESIKGWLVALSRSSHLLAQQIRQEGFQLTERGEQTLQAL
ncbi:hypothetical protein KTAU_25050 [Thermogemmatispora aurantia]|uniref:Uncharacterized protein n=1 Tax=Thermogemmatispora aurantia TaxID=2045279 RepID=A0A5J4K5D3_9CHLR|nr:hypothetical protein KTAU_25050 [Thermogemmatispora aurantia]